MLAQWNAVYVDGEWRLLDVFWASTCLVGRHSADWALLDSDGELVDSNDVQVNTAPPTSDKPSNYRYIVLISRRGKDG